MLAEVCRYIAWYWTDLTGGTSGLAGIPPPDPINLFGLTTIVFDTKIAFFYLMLVIVIISIFILYRIEHSWFGLMWSAINESDVLAQTVGINIMGHKMLIFCITSFFMGIAGALYAHYVGMLSPYGIPGSPFGFTASIYILIYVVVGGENRFSGPIIGAILLTFIPELARGLKEYMPLIFGGLLILFIFILPNGISGLITPINYWFNRTIKYLQMRYKKSDSG
jgi:branched-chain amino acid transport system permease protein